jgi:hypothetical protein
MSKIRRFVPLLVLALVSSVVLAQEQKPKSNNERHSIRVETDSGRYGVGADRLDPRQLGVAIYPGAKVVERDHDGKGAALSLDWGRDSMRLYAQEYETTDSPDRVLAFYRKQLAKYGAVLECRNGKALAPVASELKCESDKDNEGIELKAGSARRQHIVAVTPRDGRTEFGLVYLDKSKRGEL